MACLRVLYGRTPSPSQDLRACVHCASPRASTRFVTILQGPLPRHQHLTMRRTLEAQVRLDLKADAAGPHALRERMELVHAQRHAPVRHRHRVAVHCGAQSSLVCCLKEMFQGLVRLGVEGHGSLHDHPACGTWPRSDTPCANGLHACLTSCTTQAPMLRRYMVIIHCIAQQARTTLGLSASGARSAQHRSYISETGGNW